MLHHWTSYSSDRNENGDQSRFWKHQQQCMKFITAQEVTLLSNTNKLSQFFEKQSEYFLCHLTMGVTLSFLFYNLNIYL